MPKERWSTISIANRYDAFLDDNNKLGGGGFGDVYRGYDNKLEQCVAVKFLKPNLRSDAKVVEKFEREAAVLSELDHPNVLKIYDFVFLENSEGTRFPAMITELVGPKTIHQMLYFKRKTFSLEETASIIDQVCSVADYLDLKGITHRDIKPSNIGLGTENKVKVLDFGSCTAVSPINPTSIEGSVGYIAPELYGNIEPSVKADIYSIGVTTHQMLTRELPFIELDEASKLGLDKTARIVFLGKRVGVQYLNSLDSDKISSSLKTRIKLKEIIEKSLAEPEDRFDHGSELSGELREIAK